MMVYLMIIIAIFGVVSAYYTFLIMQVWNDYVELEIGSKVLTIISEKLFPSLTNNNEDIEVVTSERNTINTVVGGLNWVEFIVRPELRAVQRTKVCIRDDCGAYVYVYQPPTFVSSLLEKLPAFLYIHGGGWVQLHSESVDPKCRAFSLDGNYIVINLEYRLAPEHFFPAAVEDAYSALKWTREHITEFGGDPTKLIVGGDSAGGNLAAVVGLLDAENSVRNRLDERIKALLLIYPVTSYTSEQAKLYSPIYGILSPDRMRYYRRLYTNNSMEALKDDYRYAPLAASDAQLSRLPPTVLIHTKHDVLADEGVQFGERLRNVHVHVQSLWYNQSIHGFYGRAVFLEGHRAAQDSIVALNKIISSAQPQ